MVSRWNYKRTANYGSDDYRVSDGKPGRDPVNVSQVSVSRDRQSVFLHIADMTPCMQMRIKYRLQGTDGESVAGFVDHTVHVLKELDLPICATDSTTDSPRSMASVSVRRRGAELRGVKPGLVCASHRRSRSLRRVMSTSCDRWRCVPTPGANRRPLFASQDHLSHSGTALSIPSFRPSVTFQAQATGALVVWVNDRVVMRADSAADHDLASELVTVTGGFEPLADSTRHSLPDGQAVCGCIGNVITTWRSCCGPRCWFTIRAWFLNLSTYLQRRMGRELVARFRCARCHDAGDTTGGMPEMNLDLPALTGIADRLSSDWLRRWISDPQAMRNDITMPHVLHASSQQEVADIVAYLETAFRQTRGLDRQWLIWRAMNRSSVG